MREGCKIVELLTKDAWLRYKVRTSCKQVSNWLCGQVVAWSPRDLGSSALGRSPFWHRGRRCTPPLSQPGHGRVSRAGPGRAREELTLQHDKRVAQTSWQTQWRLIAVGHLVPERAREGESSPELLALVIGGLIHFRSDIQWGNLTARGGWTHHTAHGTSGIAQLGHPGVAMSRCRDVAMEGS